MQKVEDKKKVPLKPEVLFLSLGGIGFLPKSPGTFASITTIIPLYFLAQYNAPYIIFIPILLIMLGFSIFLTSNLQKKFQIEDPSWIVIDEFFGVFAMWPFLGRAWPQYLAAFILFRLLDIFKPGLIGWIDRNLKNGFGVMLDDIISGLLAGFLSMIFFKLFNLS